MSKSPRRVHRIADLIQQEVASLLRKQASDPRFSQVSITAVDLSPDLRNAKIYFVLMNDQESMPIAAALNKASGFFRHELAHSVELRYVPKIKFIYDDAFSSAQRISNILGDK